MSKAQNLTQAAFVSRRNRVINGFCGISQYPAASAIAAGTLNVYGPTDRMKSNNSGAGTLTPSRSFETYNGNTQIPFHIITATTASGALASGAAAFGTYHIIEGINAYDLIGQPVTVQFLFYCSTAGTYAVALRDSGAAYSCVQNFTASAGIGWYSVTFPAIPTTATIPATTAAGLWLHIANMAGSAMQTATLGAWQAGGYVTSTTALNWANTAGAFIGFSNVKLEAGSFPTQFEYPEYGAELRACQRYYFTQGGASAQYGSGGVWNATTAYVMGFFPVVMRVAPTMAFSALSTFWFSTPPGNANPSAFQSTYMTTFGYQIQMTVSGATAGQVCFLQSANSAASLITYSAEL